LKDKTRTWCLSSYNSLPSDNKANLVATTINMQQIVTNALNFFQTTTK